MEMEEVSRLAAHERAVMAQTTIREARSRIRELMAEINKEQSKVLISQERLEEAKLRFDEWVRSPIPNDARFSHKVRQAMHEISIIWTEDISNIDYVREIEVDAGTRQRPVRWTGEGRRVGYAVLSKDAPGRFSMFRRRLFCLKDYDRDRDPEGTYKHGAPCEAVDPRTVAPNKPGELTERAWGGPLAPRELDKR